MCGRYMRRGISLFLSVLLCFAAGLTGTAVEEDGAAGVLYDLSFDTEDPPRATLDFGRTGDQYMRGQGFVAVKGGDMTSVDVHIARIGSPSTLIAKLYACDDMGLPQGEPIAQTTLPADAVPADTAGVVSIPLAYEGLEAGGRYMVALGQETANYDNDYRWTVSCDASNPDWWQDWLTNPQVRQDGFAGDLPSLKFEEGGGMVDESRCGDLWMQVQGIPSAEAGGVYDLSFDTEDPPRALIDFGRTGDQYMRGQGFVAVEGGDLTSVDVHIARIGSPSTLIARLYACDDMGLPQGEPIAQTTLPADAVPADTAGVVSIPLSYEGLEAGGRYMVALGQETADYNNDYRWTVSCDASNPDW